MNKLIIDNKEIKLSDEAIKELKEKLGIKSTIKESSEVSVVDSYKFMYEINWDEKERIKVVDKKDRQIYVNQYFDDKSIFGNHCVFIRCKFGYYCEFGSFCKFGDDCEFGDNCKFGDSNKKE